MQKLCSSLCSNSVGSRNNDSRPTSPFRHHFLPHSQGKSPIQPPPCPTEAAPFVTWNSISSHLLLLYVILDPGPLLIRFVIIDLNPSSQDSVYSLTHTTYLFDLTDALNMKKVFCSLICLMHLLASQFSRLHFPSKQVRLINTSLGKLLNYQVDRTYQKIYHQYIKKYSLAI